MFLQFDNLKPGIHLYTTLTSIMSSPSLQLKFEVKTYFQNKRNADDFYLQKNLKTLRKPVDKHKYVFRVLLRPTSHVLEVAGRLLKIFLIHLNFLSIFRWYMTPSTVNAYYSPSRNQIGESSFYLESKLVWKAKKTTLAHYLYRLPKSIVDCEIDFESGST